MLDRQVPWVCQDRQGRGSRDQLVSLVCQDLQVLRDQSETPDSKDRLVQWVHLDSLELLERQDCRERQEELVTPVLQVL